MKWSCVTIEYSKKARMCCCVSSERLRNGSDHNALQPSATLLLFELEKALSFDISNSLRDDLKRQPKCS